MALAMVWIFFRIIQLPLACALNLLNKQLPSPATHTPPKKEKRKQKTTKKKKKKETKKQTKKKQIGTAMYLYCIYALLRLFRVTL